MASGSAVIQQVSFGWSPPTLILNHVSLPIAIASVVSGPSSSPEITVWDDIERLVSW
jgi:hypothetical protein